MARISSVWGVPFGDAGRSRRVGQLITVVCVLSLSDLLFTLWAHYFTSFHEINPLARAMLEAGQVGLLVVFKAVLTAGGVAVLWRSRRHGQAELGLWVVAAAYLLLALRWSDYTIMAPGIGS